MLFRSVAALVLTPLVGGAIPAVSYIVASSWERIDARDIIQVGAWVIFSFLFECIALLPLARHFRASTYFRLRVFLLGSITWLLLSLAWFYLVFGISLKGALATLLPLSISGIAICATFAGLWGRAQHA